MSSIGVRRAKMLGARPCPAAVGERLPDQAPPPAPAGAAARPSRRRRRGAPRDDAPSRIGLDDAGHHDDRDHQILARAELEEVAARVALLGFGTRIAVTISSGRQTRVAIAVDEARASARCARPLAARQLDLAHRAPAGWAAPSPAGEAVQMLPASVPRFWICAPPTSRAASFRPSNSGGSSARIRSVQVVSAPMRQCVAVLGDAAQAGERARCRECRCGACRPSRRAPPWPDRRRCRRPGPSRPRGADRQRFLERARAVVGGHASLSLTPIASGRRAAAASRPASTAPSAVDGDAEQRRAPARRV